MNVKGWHGGELRRDHWSDEWAVLAPDRDSRAAGSGPCCPFCPGAERHTAPETWRLTGADGSWRIRAVTNRHALSDHHEVVIESPRHDWDLATATTTELADVLHAWQHRHRALRADAAQVVLFHSHGPRAGIHLPHPHSQLVGLPVVSAATRRELDALQAYHRANGHRLADGMLAQELSCGERVVHANELVVAYVPFAPSTDFELRIMPRIPRADFAEVVRTVLAALRRELADPSYHLIVHTAPTGLENVPYLSWNLRVLPRVNPPTGLELATGIPVLTTTPETSASRLRAHVLVGSP